ncbi:hypothetical protein [Actinocrinis sp.]|uniref:hypothetical protein n=1 Tax=Actinocrinis sp. TaxID=1920516 RepID=UPI002B9941E0|nr:hypothetical protein [Actinocrinis sp.]HXR74010.1 hypothetical protein [Actinocrinis sp.]
MSTLSAFFAWPSGGVWSNLLAAAMWAVPGFTTHHLLIRRHQTKTVKAQTEELKAHIDATWAAPQQGETQ